MKETFAKVEEMADHIKEYMNNRITTVKLKTAEKSSKILAQIITLTIVLVIFLIFIVFAGIALAYALARLTGEFYWGFLIVAVLFLLLALLIWKTKEKLIRLPIMNTILHQLFNEQDNDEKN